MSGRVYRFVFGKEQPQWLWDMALELRIPAFVFAWCVYVNTRCYYDALGAYQANARWGITMGKLLEIQKLNYRYISVPRYSVKYEYEVDGQRYVSTRATTGSPYRDWMARWYTDTITEAEYLQAIPVLRAGESCLVYYDKRNPGKHAALAHDANSFEISILCFLAVFPLLMGYSLKVDLCRLYRAYAPARRMRIGFPAYNRPPPPPPPPPPPRHVSSTPS